MKKVSAILILALFLIITACTAQQQTTDQQTPQQQIKANKGVSAGGESAYVRIRDYKFVPKELHVKARTTVTWKNDDSAPHNVVSADETLQSQNLQKGNSWSYTFDKSGTYNYICSIHPFMQGSVIVE